MEHIFYVVAAGGMTQNLFWLKLVASLKHQVSMLHVWFHRSGSGAVMLWPMFCSEEVALLKETWSRVLDNHMASPALWFKHAWTNPESVCDPASSLSLSVLVSDCWLCPDILLSPSHMVVTTGQWHRISSRNRSSWCQSLNKFLLPLPDFLETITYLFFLPSWHKQGASNDKYPFHRIIEWPQIRLESGIKSEWRNEQRQMMWIS